MGTACEYTIDRTRLHWGQIPVDLTFSYGKVDYFPFVIVRLSAGGAEGVGEALTTPTGFFDRLMSPLIGRDARGLDSLLPTADSAEERSVCDAVSIALHDLVGRIAGLPVRTLLGGSQSDRVPLMPCIFPDNPKDAEQKAERFVAQGFRYLKTKLVGAIEEDVARVKAIRRVAPDGIVLQGDANEGYKTLAEARRAVEECGAFGLDIFEDPLLGGVEEYAKLKGCPGSRVMIDKLARRGSDLAAALRRNACDVVGIHPVQPGGLSKAMRHARMAQTFGVPVVIGGTGYTGIGTAAYQQLTACATPDGPCGELGGAFDHGMPRSLAREPLPVKDGFALLGDAPGIGVELDENALSEFQTGAKEWGS